MKRFYQGLLLPSSLLSGTIIGAGIFSLPFVFNTVGVVQGLGYLVLAAGAYLFIHMMYADIILSTPGRHRFVGYARMYLGNFASWISLLITVIAVLVTLTVYLVLSQSFLDLITLMGSGEQKMFLFWAIASSMILLGVRRIAKIEFLITVGILFIVLLLFGFSVPQLNRISFLPKEVGAAYFLLPLAPILFAVAGRSAIPSLTKYFNYDASRGKEIRRALSAGTIVPAIVFVAFSLSVISLSSHVSEDGVTGLMGSIPPWALGLIGVLGLISILSSYVLTGFNVSNILRLDLKLRFPTRILIVLGGPLLVYFSGFQGFIQLVSIGGGIFGALQAIFVIAMWRASVRRNSGSVLLSNVGRIVPLALMVLFISVFLWEMWSIFFV